MCYALQYRDFETCVLVVESLHVPTVDLSIDVHIASAERLELLDETNPPREASHLSMAVSSVRLYPILSQVPDPRYVMSRRICSH